MNLEIDGENVDLLVVDDDEQVLNLICDILAQQDYNLTRASDGNDALNLIQEKNFDLILLDINLPGKSGFEIASTLNQDSNKNKTPILFITGYSEKNDIVTAFEIGGFDYVTKPINTKELLARVEHALAINQYQKQLSTQVRKKLKI